MLRITILSCVLTSVLSAQSVTGTIIGSVSDPTGIPVSGAEVAVRQPSTGLERQVTTAQNGSFAFLESLAIRGRNVLSLMQLAARLSRQMQFALRVYF